MSWLFNCQQVDPSGRRNGPRVIPQHQPERRETSNQTTQLTGRARNIQSRIDTALNSNSEMKDILEKLRIRPRLYSEEEFKTKIQSHEQFSSMTYQEYLEKAKEFQKDLEAGLKDGRTLSRDEVIMFGGGVVYSEQAWDAIAGANPNGKVESGEDQLLDFTEAKSGAKTVSDHEAIYGVGSFTGHTGKWVVIDSKEVDKRFESGNALVLTNEQKVRLLQWAKAHWAQNNTGGANPFDQGNEVTYRRAYHYAALTLEGVREEKTLGNYKYYTVNYTELDNKIKAGSFPVGSTQTTTRTDQTTDQGTDPTQRQGETQTTTLNYPAVESRLNELKQINDDQVYFVFYQFHKKITVYGRDVKKALLVNGDLNTQILEKIKNLDYSKFVNISADDFSKKVLMALYFSGMDVSKFSEKLLAIASRDLTQVPQYAFQAKVGSRATYIRKETLEQMNVRTTQFVGETFTEADRKNLAVAYMWVRDVRDRRGRLSEEESKIYNPNGSNQSDLSPRMLAIQLLATPDSISQLSKDHLRELVVVGQELLEKSIVKEVQRGQNFQFTDKEYFGRQQRTFDTSTIQTLQQVFGSPQTVQSAQRLLNNVITYANDREVMSVREQAWRDIEQNKDVFLAAGFKDNLIRYLSQSENSPEIVRARQALGKIGDARGDWQRGLRYYL